MIPSSKDFAKLVRQFWNRRREFGQPEFWAKVGRVGTRLAQTWAWPESYFRESIRVLEDRPWNLHIEVTNACNADCVFCGYQHMERPKKMLPWDVYETALKQYIDIGGGDLLLTVVVGDPVLDPTFIEKIKVARSHPEIASIETITNGIGVDKLGPEKLIESGISRLQISTAGFHRQNYEAVYRSKSYDRMRGNVLAMLKANEKAGRPVELTIAFRTNRPLEDVMADPDFQEIKAYKPLIDFTFAYDDWLGKVDLPEGFIRREPQQASEACAWLYDGPIVFSNGDLGLCGCRDVDAKSDLVMGNIMKKSLREIWTSPEVKRLRDNFVSDRPDICNSCSMYRNLDNLRTFKGLERTRLTRRRLASSRCEVGAVPAREVGRRLPLVSHGR